MKVILFWLTIQFISGVSLVYMKNLKIYELLIENRDAVYEMNFYKNDSKKWTALANICMEDKEFKKQEAAIDSACLGSAYFEQLYLECSHDQKDD